MIEVSSKFIDRNKGTEIYLFESDLDAAPYFNQFVQGSEVKFYDINSKKSNFNSADFTELLKVYKEKIYPAICPAELQKNFDVTRTDLLESGKVIMKNSGAFGYGNVQELCLNNSF
ncbi:hypothetical protein [Ruminiclostridium herbifermentans]|nr:hypothetical protein [Ruminiclostridium herbifermentans]